MTIDRQVELNTKAIKLLAEIVENLAYSDPNNEVHRHLLLLGPILAAFDADEQEAGK